MAEATQRTAAQNIVPRILRRWRRGALLPFACLAAACAALLLATHIAFGQPWWSPPVAFAIALAAALLDARRHWAPQRICRQLDRHYPTLQDSSQLLLQPECELAPLARLQRQRVAAALQQLDSRGALRTFHPDWRRKSTLAALALCLGIGALEAAVYLPVAERAAAPTRAVAGAGSLHKALRRAQTLVEPPAYTALPGETQSLDVRAPENSQVTWRLELEQPAHGLHMLAAHNQFAFSTQEPLPSRHWQLTRTLREKDFYQLSIQYREQQQTLPGIFDIEVVADRAPEFEFSPAQQSLVLADLSGSAAEQTVEVWVSDDYGVEETRIAITLASGSGENIQFRNHTSALTPAQPEGDTDGDRKKLRYRFPLPISQFHIQPGDELYWHLEAHDNRQPEANVSRSQNFILRWPQPDLFGLSDAEGMAVERLPEYFRSQRQLIIDTEALLAEREHLSAKQFRSRSEALAFEQNLLRMRYGHFLGEEDSELEHAEHNAQAAHEAEREHEDEHEHGHGHHQHEGPESDSAAARGFGVDSGIAAAAGHQHDSPEHATLFDSQTRELLRAALNAMWQSWRELSVLEPAASLPHQHTALAHIKQVQQASRIYLHRIGFEPPRVTEERRLSGERDGILPAEVRADRAARDLGVLKALLLRLRAGEPLDAPDSEQLHTLPQLRAQPEVQMALAKALRQLEQEPDCEPCRAQVAGILYRLLPPPQARPGMPTLRAETGPFAGWRESAEGGE